MHNDRPRQTSAAHRLLASIWTIPAVALAFVGAALAWVSYDEYQQTIEQEYRFLEAHARIAESQLAGLLRNVRQLLKRIADERPAIPATRLAVYETTLAERKRDLPELRTLAVLGTDGHVELTINPSLQRFDGSKREYFTAHRDADPEPNFHIARPFKSSFGDYSVTFSVGMRDDRGRFLGVVVAGVNYRYFESVMKQIQPPGAGSIAAIVNNEGDIIYRLPDPEKYVGANVAGGAPFQAFIRSGGQMTRNIGLARTDGVDRMYVHSAIGNTPLSITVARPLDDVLAAWRRNLVQRAALFVLAAAVTLRLAWIAHRRQKEVLAGKEFSEQLIETANAMVVGVDATSRIIFVNEAAERISGYRRDELLGRSFFDTVMPRERYPDVWNSFLRYQEIGEVARAFETPLLTKAGEERIIAWQNSPLRKNGDMAATLSFGIDVTEHKQLEQTRDKEEISRRLVAIQEEERRRLAVELHDRTSPNLSAININFKLLADSLPERATKELSNLLEDTAATLEDTIASVRAISTDFRPPLLDYAGFWPALEGYARQFSRYTGIEVQTEEDALDARLTPDVETNLFRIAQEALSNCAKHSQAQTVSIRQTKNGDVVALTIADDGIGFNPDAGEPGHGLTTMRRRAEFIGGNFRVDTRPGKGTRIAVEFSALSACVPILTAA